MKLLVVSPYLPSPTWGFSARSYHLLKTLARKYAVSLLALDERTEKGASDDTYLLKRLTYKVQLIPRSAPHLKRLKQLANVVRGSSTVLNAHIMAEMQQALDALLAQDCYDAVLFESVLSAGYYLPEDLAVVIDQHNIEYELLQRTSARETAWARKWYNQRESRLVKPVEIERCRRADMVLVTSERERLLLKSLLPGSVIEVVPNGVDIETFHRDRSEREVSSQIVFTGSMDYYPNIDAVLFFAQHCWPFIRAQIPDATWQIVGKNPQSEVQKLAELPGVTVTGSVPDVQPFLAKSAVAIAPLLIGSGTRLKILEALAMQKAVVSTSLGCEGLSLVPGKHLIVADQPEAFAQAVVELVKNPEKRRTLGTAGRSLVEAEYSWERCGDQLLHALEKMS